MCVGMTRVVLKSDGAQEPSYNITNSYLCFCFLPNSGVNELLYELTEEPVDLGERHWLFAMYVVSDVCCINLIVKLSFTCTNSNNASATSMLQCHTSGINV